MRLCLAALLLIAGCDRVFRLDYIETPDGDGARVVPVFVQSAAAGNTALGSSMEKVFATPLSERSLVVAFVSWTGANNVTRVTAGGVVLQRLGSDIRQSGLAQAMYYGENMSAGAEQVVATWDLDAPNRDLRILEYASVAIVDSVDAQATATGNSALATATVTTVNADDVLVCGVAFGTWAAGPGLELSERNITPSTGSISQDRVVTQAGMYEVTAPQTAADNWVLQVAAFKGG